MICARVLKRVYLWQTSPISHAIADLISTGTLSEVRGYRLQVLLEDMGVVTIHDWHRLNWSDKVHLPAGLWSPLETLMQRTDPAFAGLQPRVKEVLLMLLHGSWPIDVLPQTDLESLTLLTDNQAEATRCTGFRAQANELLTRRRELDSLYASLNF